MIAVKLRVLFLCTGITVKVHGPETHGNTLIEKEIL